jgi:hypothetical protein
MKINLVKSSNVLGLSYSRKSQIMTVVFKYIKDKHITLSIYQYFEVPQHIYVRVLKADSVGTSLNTLIKGTYTYERVADE